jgi:hypothetical protein
LLRWQIRRDIAWSEAHPLPYLSDIELVDIELVDMAVELPEA